MAPPPRLESTSLPRVEIRSFCPEIGKFVPTRILEVPPDAKTGSSFRVPLRNGQGSELTIWPNSVSAPELASLRNEIERSQLFRQYYVQQSPEPRVQCLLHEYATTNLASSNEPKLAVRNTDASPSPDDGRPLTNDVQNISGGTSNSLEFQSDPGQRDISSTPTPTPKLLQSETPERNGKQQNLLKESNTHDVSKQNDPVRMVSPSRRELTSINYEMESPVASESNVTLRVNGVGQTEAHQHQATVLPTLFSSKTPIKPSPPVERESQCITCGNVESEPPNDNNTYDSNTHSNQTTNNSSSSRSTCIRPQQHCGAKHDSTHKPNKLCSSLVSPLPVDALHPESENHVETCDPNQTNNPCSSSVPPATNTHQLRPEPENEKANSNVTCNLRLPTGNSLQPGYSYGSVRLRSAAPLSALPGVHRISQSMGRRLNVNHWDLGVQVVCYRDGKDRMGKHADDAQGETLIATLLVAEDTTGDGRPLVIQPFRTVDYDAVEPLRRRRQRRRKLLHPEYVPEEGDEEYSLFLRPGDVYAMNGEMQNYYVHSIPRKMKSGVTNCRIVMVMRTGTSRWIASDSGTPLPGSPAASIPPPISYVFGNRLPGLKDGHTYSRDQLVHGKYHQARQRGISGNCINGCDAIIVSGSDQQIEDDCFSILRYAARNRQGSGALIQSCRSQRPLRVFRSSGLANDLHAVKPTTSALAQTTQLYRYDGLYMIVVAHAVADKIVCTLVRCPAPKAKSNDDVCLRTCWKNLGIAELASGCNCAGFDESNPLHRYQNQKSSDQMLNEIVEQKLGPNASRNPACEAFLRYFEPDASLASYNLDTSSNIDGSNSFMVATAVPKWKPLIRTDLLQKPSPKPKCVVTKAHVRPQVLRVTLQPLKEVSEDTNRGLMTNEVAPARSLDSNHPGESLDQLLFLTRQNQESLRDASVVLSNEGNRSVYEEHSRWKLTSNLVGYPAEDYDSSLLVSGMKRPFQAIVGDQIAKRPNEPRVCTWPNAVCGDGQSGRPSIKVTPTTHQVHDLFKERTKDNKPHALESKILVTINGRSFDVLKEKRAGICYLAQHSSSSQNTIIVTINGRSFDVQKEKGAGMAYLAKLSSSSQHVQSLKSAPRTSWERSKATNSGAAPDFQSTRSEPTGEKGRKKGNHRTAHRELTRVLSRDVKPQSKTSHSTRGRRRHTNRGSRVANRSASTSRPRIVLPTLSPNFPKTSKRLSRRTRRSASSGDAVSCPVCGINLSLGNMEISDKELAQHISTCQEIRRSDRRGVLSPF